MTDYTRKLAKYLADLRYEEIPPEVVQRAKCLTMHCVGAALAAHDMKPALSAVSTGRHIAGGGNEMLATLWGYPEKIPYLGAIMANSTASDTLDWEDCSWTGHPTAAHIPVAMAMGEALKKSGKDYLTAVIGGFEVYQRIASYIQPPKNFDHVKDGWGLTSWQIYAGSMTAAKMWELDADQMNLAMGAAAVTTPVVSTVMQTQMSDFYHLHFGYTSYNGTIIAGMAKRGELDNLYDIMDVEGGYPKMMRGFVNEGWLDRNLGTEYLFMELLFKHWPANMWIQTPLDCLATIQKQYGFHAEDIQEIHMTPHIQYRDRFCPDGYTSIKQAQFSTPYCLAAYMLNGEQGPGWYEAEKLKDPKVLDLAAKVKIEGEDILLMEAFDIFVNGSFPKVSMRITRKDGAVCEGEMQFPKGHPRNPMTWEECIQTFRIGAKQADLSAENTEKFIEYCGNLEKLEDITCLAECLRTN